MSMETEDAFAEEIADIFVEEVQDVLAQMDKHLPLWKSNSNDSASLKEIRRAFHTLKGSGRMVQAEQIAELAWAVENLLNRVLDGSLAVNPLMFELVEQVRKVVPVLLQAFRNRQAAALAGVNIPLLIEHANHLREGRDVQSLHGFVLPGAIGRDEPEDTVVHSGIASAELDNANERITNVINQLDEIKRDWVALNARVDVIKNVITELKNLKATDEIERHLLQSDREIKELKYFIKASSEEMLASAKETQMRLSNRVDQELNYIRDTVHQVKTEQRTEREVIRTEMSSMIKVWALGCSITFSIVVLLVSIIL